MLSEKSHLMALTSLHKRIALKIVNFMWFPDCVTVQDLQLSKFQRFVAHFSLNCKTKSPNIENYLFTAVFFVFYFLPCSS